MQTLYKLLREKLGREILEEEMREFRKAIAIDLDEGEDPREKQSSEKPYNKLK